MIAHKIARFKTEIRKLDKQSSNG